MINNGLIFMPAEIVHKILNRIGHPDLVETLGKLSGTELNSLLLEVFSQQANSLTPPQLLNLYQKNRFVKPADLPVIVRQAIGERLGFRQQ